MYIFIVCLSPCVFDWCCLSDLYLTVVVCVWLCRENVFLCLYVHVCVFVFGCFAVFEGCFCVCVCGGVWCLCLESLVLCLYASFVCMSHLCVCPCVLECVCVVSDCCAL